VSAGASTGRPEPQGHGLARQRSEVDPAATNQGRFELQRCGVGNGVAAACRQRADAEDGGEEESDPAHVADRIARSLSAAMRTRTLLLLAVTCGLAILVAGTLQLLRLKGQETGSVLAVGEAGTAGDAKVTLLNADVSDDMVVLKVVLSGVDDPLGTKGFTLVGPDKTVAPNSTGDDACNGFTVAPVTCTLSFGTATMPAGNRLLVFQRAEETVRWKVR